MCELEDSDLEALEDLDEEIKLPVPIWCMTWEERERRGINDDQN